MEGTVSIKRWVVFDEEGHDGSIYACSLDCAQAAQEVLAPGGKLGECQGRDGVDERNACDGGCDW